MAIVDLIQVRSDVDGGFYDAAQPIYERYGEGHAGPPVPDRDQVGSADATTSRGRPAGFMQVAVRRYDWDHTYSAAEYRELMISYSTTQSMAPAARAGLLDGIEDLVRQRFDGEVARAARRHLDDGYSRRGQAGDRIAGRRRRRVRGR